MVDRDQDLGRQEPLLTSGVPEWTGPTREALERKGVRFLQLGRPVSEILPSLNVTILSRDVDDFITGQGLHSEAPQFSEVGILPEPITGGNSSLYAREDVMRGLALEVGQGLKPEEQAYKLVTPDLPDLLDVFAQLSQDEETQIENSWTNTRTYDDRFLTISFHRSDFVISDESASLPRGLDLVPLIVPVRLYSHRNHLYPQLQSDLMPQPAK